MNILDYQMRKQQLILYFLVFATASFLVLGCSRVTFELPQSGSGFLKKEFLAYKSVAILPFEGDGSGEVADTFALQFHQRFPAISVIERRQVVEAIGPAIPRTPVDEKTRYAIRERLGVNALVRGEIHFPSIVQWFLQVEILDTETGDVLGRSLVGEKYSGALKKEDAARLAVENLRIR